MTKIVTEIHSQSRVSGIYEIRNLVNGKIYIGSAVNLYERRIRHFVHLRRGIHGNSRLQNSFNKHGEENFVFSVLEIVDKKEDLIKREQAYFDEFKPEYNICKIAGSSLGVKLSQETKNKISLAQKGKKLSPESIEKTAAAHRGVPRPDYVREKISKSNTGKTLSEEHRRKLSLAKQNISEEHRRKLSEARRKRVTSEETKLKMSNTWKKKEVNAAFTKKGHKTSQETKEKHLQPHFCKYGCGFVGSTYQLGVHSKICKNRTHKQEL